jgi:hypothetical protein
VARAPPEPKGNEDNKFQKFLRQARNSGARAAKFDTALAKMPPSSAIQKIQTSFVKRPNRLYHWAQDRAVAADNNRAERQLRPLVIARKLSFGSQSEAGARTREVLMSVLHTLRKRTDDVTAAFQRTLDRLAETQRSISTNYSSVLIPPEFPESRG